MAPKHGVAIDQTVEMVDNALNNPALREQMSDWRTNIDAIGVLSLTEMSNDMLMWAHYANSHKGYCLELDATVPPLSLAYRVSYADERPIFRIFDQNRLDIIQRALLHKAKFWENEREWRVVTTAKTRQLIFPAKALKSIIFGASMEDEDELALRSIAAERQIPVTFKRAKLDDRNYELAIVDA